MMRVLFSKPFSIIIPLFLTALVLAVFNFYYLSGTNARQDTFNRWLNEMERATPEPSRDVEVPLSVQLESSVPSFQGAWKVSANLGDREDESALRMRRILKLFRDASIFNKSLPTDNRGDVRFELKGPSKEFRVSFSKEQVEGDIQLQNLIRLVQLFSEQERALLSVKEEHVA